MAATMFIKLFKYFREIWYPDLVGAFEIAGWETERNLVNVFAGMRVISL